jgi:sugar lactone lactonase YvrE
MQRMRSCLVVGLALAVASSCASPGAPLPPSPRAPTAVAATPAFEPGDASDELGVAIAAYKAGDKLALLASAERAVKIQPGRPRALYTLAAAYAVSGRPDDALAALGRLARLGVYVDLGAENDFASLRSLPAYARLVQAFDALRARSTHASVVAFRLPEKDFVPEGIAHDDATGAFFVSSVHRRKIVRVDPSGASRDFTSEADGLLAITGIALDAPRRLVWACTSGVPEMRGYTKADADRAFVVALDLATGRVARKLPLEGSGPHACNDLFLDADGTVYVSDAGAGELLVLRPGQAALASFVKEGFRSPQAMAVLGGVLYVADWTHGLARVDRATGRVRWLDAPDDVLLVGIDGMRAYGGELIAIQNASDPHRVVALTIDGDRVGKERILEWNHPEFHEPTLGVVVGKDLYFVADSQWGSFDKDGKIWPLDKLLEPTVLRLRLEP